LFVDRAIGHWRRRLECVVQQQGGHIDVIPAVCDSYFRQLRDIDVLQKAGAYATE